MDSGKLLSQTILLCIAVAPSLSSCIILYISKYEILILIWWSEKIDCQTAKFNPPPYILAISLCVHPFLDSVYRLLYLQCIKDWY